MVETQAPRALAFALRFVLCTLPLWSALDCGGETISKRGGSSNAVLDATSDAEREAASDAAASDVPIEGTPDAGNASDAALERAPDEGASDAPIQTAPDAELDAMVLCDAILLASPPAYDFGRVTEGLESAPVIITVTNVGCATSGLLSLGLGGFNPQAFVVDSDTCVGQLLPPSGVCTIALRFVPRFGLGRSQGALTVFATPGGSATVLLSGTTSSGMLACGPVSHDFGAVAVGTSAAQTFTLLNETSISLTAPVVVLTGAADFAVPTGSNQCTSALAPGDECTFVVTYAPSTAGKAMAVVIATSASGFSASASLIGIGR